VHIRELFDRLPESAAAGVGAVASQVRAVTTGFMDLDTLLTTGLKRGDLIVAAARPSPGKDIAGANFAKSSSNVSRHRRLLLH
jgi:replicative DNA helicase